MIGYLSEYRKLFCRRHFLYDKRALLSPRDKNFDANYREISTEIQELGVRIRELRKQNKVFKECK